MSQLSAQLTVFPSEVPHLVVNQGILEQTGSALHGMHGRAFVEKAY